MKLNKREHNFFNNKCGKNPILNWRFDSNDDVATKNYTVGDGYYEASIYLIDGCIDNKISADVVIFPIMFSVNHFIELYLKSILVKIKQYDNDLYGDLQINYKENGHDLKKLINKFCEWQKKSNTLLANDDDLEVIKDFIDILYEQPGYDFTFARYATAMNKDEQTKNILPNTSQFYDNTTENFGLELQLYKQWVIKIYEVLDGAMDNICELLDTRAETQ